MKASQEVRVINELGLHARPAVVIVKLLENFEADVTLHHQDISVSANSIMEILLLGVCKNDQILIEAEGKDAKSAIKALKKAFKKGFV